MSNPEFEMKGISFVISTTTNLGHPLPFKFMTPSGKRMEIQRSLKDSMDVFQVVTELRLLANEIERSVTEAPVLVDFPAATSPQQP